MTHSTRAKSPMRLAYLLYLLGLLGMVMDLHELGWGPGVRNQVGVVVCRAMSHECAYKSKACTHMYVHIHIHTSCVYAI